MRLNRFLASAGLGSRRGVEELITSGQVRINGRVVTDLATQVGPNDAVKVGSRLLRSEQPLSVLLNKPKGLRLHGGRRAGSQNHLRSPAAELAPDLSCGPPRQGQRGPAHPDQRRRPFARPHPPRYKIEKEYEVLLDKSFDLKHREKLLRGFHIMGGRAKVERLEVLGPQHLGLTLTQGIKRQIRLMLYDLGYEVERLARVRLGPLKIGEMSPGEWRLLTSKEVATLKAAVPAETRKA